MERVRRKKSRNISLQTLKSDECDGFKGKNVPNMFQTNLQLTCKLQIEKFTADHLRPGMRMYLSTFDLINFTTLKILLMM